MNEDNISGQGRIHLTLREDDGKETYFTIKRTTPMMLVFAAFCTKKNLQPRSYRFVLDGGRVIGNSDTADSLELENKCLISVCLSNPSFPPTPPPPHAALADSSVESANLPVTIKVISDDAEILFKIKRSTPMWRVFSAFNTKMGQEPGFYRFMFNGEELFEDETADTRRLVDNSVVDAIEDPFFQQPPSSRSSSSRTKKAITVKLTQEDGTYEIFKFKRSSPLYKMFDAYHSLKIALSGSYHFSYRGMMLYDTDTAESRQIADNGVINVIELSQPSCEEDESESSCIQDPSSPSSLSSDPDDGRYPFDFHRLSSSTLKRQRNNDDTTISSQTGEESKLFSSVLVNLARCGFIQEVHQIIVASRTAAIVGRKSQGGLPDLWNIMSKKRGTGGVTRLMAVCIARGSLSPFRARALVIDHKANVRAKDDYGRTALHHSLGVQEWKHVDPWPEGRPINLDLIQVLIALDPRGLKEPNKFKNLPLHCACMMNASLDVIKALLDAYPESIQAVGFRGMLPLHMLCQKYAPYASLKYVIQRYPQAQFIRDDDNVLPESYLPVSDAIVRSLFAHEKAAAKADATSIAAAAEAKKLAAAKLAAAREAEKVARDGEEIVDHFDDDDEDEARGRGRGGGGKAIAAGAIAAGGGGGGAASAAGDGGGGGGGAMTAVASNGGGGGGAAAADGTTAVATGGGAGLDVDGGGGAIGDVGGENLVNGKGSDDSSEDSPEASTASSVLEDASSVLEDSVTVMSKMDYDAEKRAVLQRGKLALEKVHAENSLRYK